MRLLPGQPADLIGQSLSGYNLTEAAVANVDRLTRIYKAYNDEEYSPLSAILAERGYFTKGLREGMWTNKFRVVKSNHVMYPIASSQKRKIHLASNENAITFYSAAYPTKPGFKGTSFQIYTDNNWARPKEVIELNDNKTQLYIYDVNEPVEYSGVWRYNVRLQTNDPDDYCNVSLLTEGSEAGVGMTQYEHDFSETGSEKYTFDGWGHAYMTLQRVKMSYSGTAAAMDTSSGNWYEFENSRGKVARGYIPFAEDLMYKRATKYHEYQIINGKTTVTVDGKVFMQDSNGRDIMAGSGLLFGNDGAVERPMTTGGWTMKFAENLIEDLDIRSGREGYKEAVICGGFKNIASFYKMMMANGFKTKDNNVEGRAGEKGVNLDYKYFEFMGVRLIPIRYRWFDSEDRPNKVLSNGERKGSWDAIVCPLGFTTEGDNMIELVQLRPPKMGTLAGIDEGGDMATSVDGTSKHYLWQTGIISRTSVYRVFMPWAA
jgi:hypothetical protein